MDVARELLHSLRHLRDRHQWPGDLVEKLIRVLLFAQRGLQQLNDRRQVKLLREVSGGDVAGHLIVFDFLRSAYQCQVSGCFVLFLPSAITSSPSSTIPIMPLQGLARA
jgi:hypothetical protein